MKAVLAFGCVALVAGGASFDVASVKRSQQQKGVDYRGQVVIGAGRLSASNVTLQHLIAVAYHVQHSQVVSSLKWLDSDEYDVDGRAEAPAGELRLMLQTLLAERFHLALNREAKDISVLALVVDTGGPKLQLSKGAFHFHGGMRQFTDLLALQATIPAPVDPSSPAIASSASLTIIDQTGLDGTYDFDVDLKPELGTDKLTMWKRALKEQLGLRLETQRTKLEVLRVVSADRAPAAN